MHKPKIGRPRNPALPVGHELPGSVVLSVHDKPRPDGGARSAYTLRCRCGKVFERGHPAIMRSGDAQCKNCAAVSAAMARGADGRTKTKEYAVWRSMRQRCENPAHAAYANYGGRGIKVCKRWAVFDNFIADMGPCPEGHSIERKKNGRGYSPANCEWLPEGLQNRNTRANVWITIAGERKLISDWAKQLGTQPGTIRLRIDKWGWSVKDACTIPTREAKLIEHKGKRMTAKQWGEKLGLPYRDIQRRLRAGHSVAEALHVGRLPRRKFLGA